MGMFDYVKCKIKCPVCGHTVNDFQSKDGPNLMFEVDIKDIDRWYGTCFMCGLNIEFNKTGKGSCYTCLHRFSNCKQSKYSVTYGCERYKDKETKLEKVKENV